MVQVFCFVRFFPQKGLPHAQDQRSRYGIALPSIVPMSPFRAAGSIFLMAETFLWSIFPVYSTLAVMVIEEHKLGDFCPVVV